MSVKEATDALIANYPGDTTYMMVDTQEGNYEDLLSLYASFLFIGIFLSFLFIMATVLIMYYKQITEGYEDKKRFEIMQKVGLNKREVKKDDQFSSFNCILSTSCGGSDPYCVCLPND